MDSLLASAKRPITIWHEAGNIVEQSSEQIWKAVCDSVKEAVATAGISPAAVAGLGFDATCSLVVVKSDGSPVAVGPSGDPNRNIIVWMDHRAAGEAAEINAGNHEVLRYVGGRISPEMETPKLLWLKRNLPAILCRCGSFLRSGGLSDLACDRLAQPVGLHGHLQMDLSCAREALGCPVLQGYRPRRAGSRRLFQDRHGHRRSRYGAGERAHRSCRRRSRTADRNACRSSADRRACRWRWYARRRRSGQRAFECPKQACLYLRYVGLLDGLKRQTRLRRWRLGSILFGDDTGALADRRRPIGGRCCHRPSCHDASRIHRGARESETLRVSLWSPGLTGKPPRCAMT